MSLESLQSVWVFVQKPESPLRYTDLIVYSYLSKREKFGGKPPTAAATSRATGLGERTVAASVSRLTEMGFVVENRPVAMSGFFFSRPGEHWYDRNQFFRCFIPSEGAPISTSDAMVFSYILHLAALRNRPRQLRTTYVANALGMDVRTVQACFDRLNKLQLLRITDAQWGVPKHLVGQQLGWFMGKLAPSVGAGADFDTFEPDLTALNSIQETATGPDNTDTPCAAPTVSDTLHLSRMIEFLTQKLRQLGIEEVEYAEHIRQVERDYCDTEERYWEALARHIAKNVESERMRIPEDCEFDPVERAECFSD